MVVRAFGWTSQRRIGCNNVRPIVCSKPSSAAAVHIKFIVWSLLIGWSLDCTFQCVHVYALNCLSRNRNYKRNYDSTNAMRIFEQEKERESGWRHNRWLGILLMRPFHIASTDKMMAIPTFCVTCEAIFMWRKDIINPNEIQPVRMRCIRKWDYKISIDVNYSVSIASFALRIEVNRGDLSCVKPTAPFHGNGFCVCAYVRAWYKTLIKVKCNRSTHRVHLG